MKNERVATGRVESLCLNGEAVDTICFDLAGLRGDVHSGFSRTVGAHDGAYRATSALHKGDAVLNWRSWTALAREEIAAFEQTLGVPIPQGCLLENLTVTGIPNLSKLPPTTRMVFPVRGGTQAMLAVWEENSPCHTVGQRLADHYGRPELKKALIAGARGKRGVMGLVLSAGWVEVDDEVQVFPPAR